MALPRWFAPAFLLCLILAIFIPLSPHYRPVPSDDPSVYLYVGQRVLDGGMPYRDAWDHKQPLAYFLYTFGLLISGHSLWGMWLIELVGLCALALIGLWLAEKLAPRPAAVFAVTAGLLTLAVIIWGYSLEELTLPLQIAVLAVFARLIEARSARQRAWLSLGIGLLTGVCFFMKQSLVGAGATVALMLALRAITRRERRALVDLAVMAGGVAAVGGVVFAYLLASHTLGDYRSAAITFNLLYADLGPLERARALLDALRYMLTVPGLLLSLGLWAVTAWAAFRQGGPLLARWICARRFAALMLAGGLGLVGLSLAGELTGGEPGLGLVQWALIVAGAGALLVGFATAPKRARERLAGWLEGAPLFAADDLRAVFFPVGALYFPITLLLLTLSGRTYVYYFIPLVPALMLLATLTGGLIARLIARLPARPRIAWLAEAGLLALVVAWIGFEPLWMVAGQYREGPHPVPAIAAYIQTNTRPDQTILAWGKDTTYTYFLANRSAPSRYFYQAAISLDSYNAQSGASDRLLADVQASPPALFLIPGKAVTGGCPLPAGSAPNSPERVFAFVCQNYTYAGNVSEFQVYKRK